MITHGSKISRGIYEHYKGKRYLVLDSAVLSGTEDDDEPTHFVLYVPLYGDVGLRVRPLVEFLAEDTQEPKRWEGTRFKYISNP